MARGFESKDVEFQQAEATRVSAARTTLTSDERVSSDTRQRLELALSSTRTQRASAQNPVHQRMVDAAIRALESQLDGLKTVT
jgi:hypothetical protein